MEAQKNIKFTLFKLPLFVLTLLFITLFLGACEYEETLPIDVYAISPNSIYRAEAVFHGGGSPLSRGGSTVRIVPLNRGLFSPHSRIVYRSRFDHHNAGVADEHRVTSLYWETDEILHINDRRYYVIIVDRQFISIRYSGGRQW